MSEDLEDRARSFAELARAYCALCDGALADADERESARRLIEALATLCAQAVLLSDVEPCDREETDRPIGRPSALPSFGERAFYRECFDPYADEPPVMGWLADDLGDVYADLQRGLVLIDVGTSDDLRDAVWTWRFDFETHWGEHATGALRALYWILTR